MTERERGNKVGRAIRGNALLASIPFVIMAQQQLIDDVTITEHSDCFPEWDINWRGLTGQIVNDGGQLYRSIHDITNSGQNTKPSQTPAMWTRIGNPQEEWPDWVQPIGAHDAYEADAKVTHKSKHWLNSHGNGNIWEPSVYGWNEL